MKKFKFLGSFILGIGIALLSSNAAVAETNKDEKNSDYIVEIAVVDEELAKKQEEIEYIVFNKNSKEIEDKGFTIVSTGMVNKFVEVRISPYNEENAEYLYNILGGDMVKVVDSEEVALIDSETDSPDALLSVTAVNEEVIDEAILNKQMEIDQYVFDQHKDEILAKGFKVTHTGPFENYIEIGIIPYNEENAEYLYNIFGRDIVKVVEGKHITIMVDEEDVHYAELYTTTTAIKEEKYNELILALLIITICIVGGVAFLISKRKVNYKR